MLSSQSRWKPTVLSMKAEPHWGLKEHFLPLLLFLFLPSPPSPSSPALVLFPLGFGSIFVLLAMAWLKRRRPPPPTSTAELLVADGVLP